MSPEWWRPRPVLRRFVCDLVQAELSRLRSGAQLPPQPWPERFALDQDLGVDSLERMTLASALAEALHLHESGIEDFLLAKGTVGEWIDLAEAGLTHFADRLTFRTSGSSGVPKACVHPMALLLQETHHLAHLFGGAQRVLSAVPSHHVYGFLFTVLLPRALGIAPEKVIDLRASTPARLAQAACEGDLVVGYPEFWQAVARTVPRMPAGVVGATSTAPCPDGVSESLERTGLARLVHVYGASETGGIGSRESHRDPYRLFPHWTFAPGSPDKLLRRLPDGSQQACAVLDSIEALDGATFRVGPRQDGAVQVGGVNVFPARVAAVLREHPLVAEAAVRLMRPDEGTRLKAFLVLREGGEAGAGLPADLHAWIDASLTAPERPKTIRTGTRLPTTAAGKQADWSIDAERPSATA